MVLFEAHKKSLCLSSSRYTSQIAYWPGLLYFLHMLYSVNVRAKLFLLYTMEEQRLLNAEKALNSELKQWRDGIYFKHMIVLQMHLSRQLAEKRMK